MTIILDTYTIPEKGPVEINLNRSFEINITAEEARRQVNRWLLNEVSYMMSADAPTLVLGEQVVWRVPAWITYPDVGRAGLVGTVEVDVTTGSMNNTPACKATLERCAEKVAARLPPYQSVREVPTDHLAKDVPPAPTLILHEDKPPTLAIPSEEDNL